MTDTSQPAPPAPPSARGVFGVTLPRAEEFADLIEELGEWGNDGVLLWGDLHPVTIHRTLDELVPVLRRRGILRRDRIDGGLHATLRAF